MHWDVTFHCLHTERNRFQFLFVCLLFLFSLLTKLRKCFRSFGIPERYLNEMSDWQMQNVCCPFRLKCHAIEALQNQSEQKCLESELNVNESAWIVNHLSNDVDLLEWNYVYTMRFSRVYSSYWHAIDNTRKFVLGSVLYENQHSQHEWQLPNHWGIWNQSMLFDQTHWMCSNTQVSLWCILVSWWFFLGIIYGLNCFAITSLHPNGQLFAHFGIH